MMNEMPLSPKSNTNTKRHTTTPKHTTNNSKDEPKRLVGVVVGGEHNTNGKKWPLRSFRLDRMTLALLLLGMWGIFNFYFLMVDTNQVIIPAMDKSVHRQAQLLSSYLGFHEEEEYSSDLHNNINNHHHDHHHHHDRHHHHDDHHHEKKKKLGQSHSHSHHHSESSRDSKSSNTNNSNQTTTTTTTKQHKHHPHVNRGAYARLLQKEPWPKIIHATTQDPNHLEKREQRAIKSCQTLNPDYDYKLYGDVEMRKYVKVHYKKLLSWYDDLETQIMRTDFWRYLVLYKEGGVYMDTDVTCVRPIDDWIKRFPPGEQPNLNVIVGVALNFPDQHYLEFSQWTMYSKPGHVLFAKTIQKIVEKVRNRNLKIDTSPADAVQITGPVPWSMAVMEHMQEFGLSKERVMEGGVHVAGDLGILDVNGFAPLQGHSGSTLNAHHPTIMVRHGFFGRWKNKTTTTTTATTPTTTTTTTNTNTTMTSTEPFHGNKKSSFKKDNSQTRVKESNTNQNSTSQTMS